MKKIQIVLAAFILQFTSNAQILTPQQSPKATISQMVGLTSVEVAYSRPSARGRGVFGDLVPFGKLWRAGANENTTVSFSDDVLIDGKTLKKGKYALFAIPSSQSWELIFYAKTDNWGTPEKYDEANVVLKTVVKEVALPKTVETFTIGINDLSTDAASLEMYWENSFVSMKFEVPTKKKALENIESALAGPTAGDYFSSAQFMYNSEVDIEKARKYIDKALELKGNDKPFYYLRLKSLIHAKQGDKKGAIEHAKLSLAAAEKAGNLDYIKMNKDSLSEWTK